MGKTAVSTRSDVPLNGQNITRSARWHAGVARLMRREFYSLRNALEGIAAMDEQLISAEDKFEPINSSNLEVPLAGMLAFEFIQWQTFQSYLWVLAGYEFIRTVDQKVRENGKCASESTTLAVKQVKRYFERVRVPLAKLEAAKKHKVTDRAIAYPMFLVKRGVAWTLNEREYVSRRDLSESLLQLIESWEPAGPALSRSRPSSG